MPVPELAKRVAAVRAATPMGSEARKSVLQHVLRLSDIARYMFLHKQALSQKPEACARYYQRELSIFFRLWDAGRLEKRKVGKTWQVVERERLAKVAPKTADEAPQAPGPRLNIDWQTGRLRR